MVTKRIIIRTIPNKTWKNSCKYVLQCNHCRKEFTITGGDYRDGVGQFCSGSCHMKYQLKNNLIKRFNKGYRHKNGNGYWVIPAPEHPGANKRGYYPEHRLVVEEHIGRLLFSSEHIHHIDENKLNNDISNLQIITPNNHMKHHATIQNKTRKRNELGRYTSG